MFIILYDNNNSNSEFLKKIQKLLGYERKSVRTETKKYELKCKICETPH